MGSIAGVPILYNGYVEAMSAKMGDLGYDATSAAGQLNYLAAWSQSTQSRINQKYHPYQTYKNKDGSVSNYTCGGTLCTISQIFTKIEFVQTGVEFAQALHPDIAN